MARAGISTGSTLGGRYVGVRKILALEQQGLPCRLRQRVGKAVAEIEARLVAAFAEIEKGLPGEFPVVERYGLKRDGRTPEKSLGLLHRLGTELAFDNHRQLNVIRHAHPAVIGIVNGLRESGGFRLPVKNGDQGGCIEDHFGRPLSS